MNRQDDIETEDLEDLDMDTAIEEDMELDFSEAARVRRMVEMYDDNDGWGWEMSE